ncbi:outer membrane protein [Alteromonas oceanisediminis]|uniref:outer membrane protein n=1 Tax=Alteromonas oceanisediminis TaxID=2836180 RepID=UPI001BDA84A8|nr:outer membrane beta-barrel protein [Alteromonas oceanisediminis]MBT0585469.1 outer membrane beta-barrel protein [Alteromonas oceanisediminis]
MNCSCPLPMNMIAATLFFVPAICSTAHAKESPWYVRSSVGVSQLSDHRFVADNVNVDSQRLSNGIWNVDSDTGFYSGLGAGYQFSSGWRTELFWEYRTNDSTTQVANAGNNFQGNLASSIVFANIYYPLIELNKWKVLVGAGIGWIQEIDIDLEDTITGTEVERSFSGDNDVAAQIMLVAEFELTRSWSVAAEGRYTRANDIALSGEENAVGHLSGFKYTPISLGISIQYQF